VATARSMPSGTSTSAARTPARRRPALAVLAVTCGVALATPLVASAPVAANPGGSHVSLKQVRQRVDALYRRAEQATERYDTARENLRTGQRALRTAQDKTDRQQAYVARLDRITGQLAAAQYRSGSVSPTLQIMLSRNPEDFVQGTANLEAVNAHQEEALRRAQAARAQLVRSKAALVTRVRHLQAVRADLATNKTQIEDRLGEARSLLSELKAKQRRRLAARQARAAQAQHVAPAAGATSPAAGGGSSTGAGSPAPAVAAPASGGAATAVAYAYAQLGDAYVWGATGPSAFDCSGLTMAAWAAAGVSLPHSSSMQASSGTPVSHSALQPGDLVFYYSPISHVAIYIGGGKVIHASQPGVPVEIAPVDSMPYSGAVRP
jgi:peptidoglycan DL-endopeptidase CwlO